MRPRRLDVRNFTVFRELEDPIDLVDVDLFALTGPTGAGKTSIIDAMCFALYGSIPRTDGVEPVVALGAGEARVHLEFSVTGVSYTVARVVRRTKTGATTAEARLEREGALMASGAKEVTASVERLLGLTFEHFTKCVVLPQGDFAAFLHETPAGRQRLMRTLLDLGLFERVRGAARSRADTAEQLGNVLSEQRAGLGDDIDVEVRAARRRLAELAEVRVRVDELLPVRGQIEASLVEVDREMDRTSRALTVLSSIRLPQALDEVLEAIDVVERERAHLKSAGKRAAADLERAEKDVARHPDRGELESTLRDLRRRTELLAAYAAATDGAAASRRAVDEASERLIRATSAHAAALAQRALLERRHAAHLLATTLELGESCPVCHQDVVQIPEVTDLDAMADAVSGVEQASAAVEEVRVRSTEADRELARREALVESLGRDVEALNVRLERDSDTDSVEDRLRARAESEAEVDRLRRLDRELDARATTLEQRSVEVQREAGAVRRAYIDAREMLAPIATPPAPNDDLRAGWSELMQWLTSEIDARSTVDTSLAVRREALVADLGRLDSSLEETMAVLGLSRLGDSTQILEQVIRAQSELESRVERLERDQLRARELDQTIADATERASVAKELARLLSARGFEPWLMQEAMMALVVGANAMLDELFGGAYSLHVAEAGFSIVDHRNADEMRAAKTLSGGETFLVSLALALSLAEHVRTVAGGAAIESVFIDEGFGTLDAASLDVVSSVLHQLGERNQMVGIVTHVAELAEQMPVRFEVERSPTGSSVRRIDT